MQNFVHQMSQVSDVLKKNLYASQILFPFSTISQILWFLLANYSRRRTKYGVVTTISLHVINKIHKKLSDNCDLFHCLLYEVKPKVLFIETFCPQFANKIVLLKAIFDIMHSYINCCFVRLLAFVRQQNVIWGKLKVKIK